MGLVCLLFASSCKDEPLNAECDIEQVILHTNHVDEVFFNKTDSAKSLLYTDNEAVFNVRRNAPLDGITLEFKITEGATIQRITEGDDFQADVPVSYRVTSQDGNWHRDYKITISPEPVHVVKSVIKYDFENFELDPQTKKYYIWHNERLDGTFGNEWATGNPGYKMSKSSALPDQYPTVPIDGMDGKALKLTTCDTGPFGAMANMRLAAGNFFLGEFDVSQALGNAMAATRFGVPFTLEPVKLSGYYQYQPGKKFQDKSGKEVVGRVDEGSIYAVMYRNHDAQGNPVPDGKLADKYLLTNLYNLTQPLIRYEVTDRIILHREVCSCGNPSPWLEIEGRNDDVLTFIQNGKTVRVPPLAIYAKLMDNEMVGTEESGFHFLEAA